MSKYHVDLDYVILPFDISREELREIIAEADRIIAENNETTAPEILALAYLKKAQSMQKLVDALDIETYNESKIVFTSSSENTNEDTQNSIKELVEKALELSPDKPEALMQMGKVFMRTPEPENKHFVKAIEMYSRAIQIKPDYAAAFNNRGMAHNPDGSKYFFPKFSDGDLGDLENTSGVPVMSLAVCIPDSDKDCFQSDSKKAIADYSEAIRLRPDDPVYYFNRGPHYSESKEHEKAIEDFSAAIHYSSDEFKRKLKIFHIRGMEYMEVKDYKKAIDDFSESMRLTPDKAESLFLRAKCRALNGEHEKAKADLAELKDLKIEAHKAAENNKEALGANDPTLSPDEIDILLSAII